MMNSTSTTKTLNFFSDLKSRALKSKEVWEKKSNFFGYIRLSALILAIVLGIGLAQFGFFVVLSIILVCSIVFVWAVFKQLNAEEYVQFLNRKLTILENECTLIHDGNTLYDNGEAFADPKHLYSTDLDVFGPYSLFLLLNRCSTYWGNQLLGKWLRDLPDLDEVQVRQNAVLELSKDPSWIIDFQAHMFSFKQDEKKDIAQSLVDLMDSKIGISTNVLLKTYISIAPILLVGLFLLGVYYPIGMTLATTLFIFNLVIVGRFFKQVSYLQEQIQTSSKQIGALKKVLRHLRMTNWRSTGLQQVYDTFEFDKHDLPKSMLLLEGILKRLDYRLNILVAVFLNGFLLWDLRIVMQFENWKQSSEQRFVQIFKNLGFIEAIVSLAMFSLHRVHYTMPKLSNEDFRLEGKDVVHPLIDGSKVVSNDIEIDADRYVSIITGSNMSGKSTYLRAIGTNLVLAYAGTVVGASHFQASIFQLITYMRIKDALEESVSTFKAELNRIDMIMNWCSKGEPRLILIDEMLRGTNSKDKLNGSIALTKHLIATKTYSFIATHDIGLADLEQTFPNAVKNYYFDIEFDDDGLIFNYKIQSGICNTFNASFLLKELGLKL